MSWEVEGFEQSLTAHECAVAGAAIAAGFEIRLTERDQKFPQLLIG